MRWQFSSRHDISKLGWISALSHLTCRDRSPQSVLLSPPHGIECSDASYATTATVLAEAFLILEAQMRMYGPDRVSATPCFPSRGCSTHTTSRCLRGYHMVIAYIGWGNSTLVSYALLFRNTKAFFICHETLPALDTPKVSPRAR